MPDFDSIEDFLTYLKAGEWNVEHIQTDEETCDSY